jgi:hypothetical protein
MDNFDHVSEDSLELYVMNRLGEEEATCLEEHILLCEPCQKRLVETETFIQAVKVKTKQLREDRFFQPPRRTWWQKFTAPVLMRPVWGGAIVAAALALVFLLPVSRRVPDHYQEVSLSAMRGAESGAAPSSNAWLRLSLDTQRLPELPAWKVLLVDASGRQIWESGTLKPEGAKISVPLDRKLAAGVYWVRLRAAGAPETVLREYQLQVE